jgi:NAD(P)-dependent dehydrogenase (short-subunit alcohol dehydrogenase family)
MADSDKLGLAGRTALITGAGGGLGRCHALLFAKHGANVVVNDLGGATDGTGKSTNMADHVVEEIEAAGGKAVANYDSVSDAAGAANMIKTATDTFGSIDIVVNNAGILRDKSFNKMEDADWDLVQAVHVKGAYHVTKAAWPHMREQKYGRVIMTSSASGIYGNFGQSNYAAAKMGLVGFGQTLALEGEKYNIRTNMIAPVAISRMTESIMPPNVHELIRPDLVSPLVVYLCSEHCDANGEVYEVGAGNYSRVEWLRAKGLSIKPEAGKEIDVDQIAANWDKINDMSDAQILRSIGESTGATLAHCM